ncbi:MAG: hypothetical protein M3463_05330 [Verrucomicrobiota bacterium]|nr:hypothetical protein [Verrucomicrobiota bacterium]
MPMTYGRKRTLRICLAVLAVLIVAVGVLAWYKLFRVLPQEDFVLNDPDMKFKYGSLGAEGDRGLPYWIWAVLPRIFPEMMPGSGGYKSSALPGRKVRKPRSGSRRKPSVFRGSLTIAPSAM